MTHPTEQLAAYVDGSLVPVESAEVDRHLATCDACRNEAAAAASARDALRSMGTPATPADLGEPALAEMRRNASASGPPTWVRFTPWLAAAAVIGVLALALPRIGSSDGDASSAASEAADAAMPEAPQDLRLEIVENDFDPSSLEAAASEFAAAARAAPVTPGALAGEADTSSGSVAPVHEAGKARSSEVLRCLRTAVPGIPGTPVRLLKASFQGTPAYLAFMVEGPGADQPADTVSIWVISSKDCSPLSLTSAAL